MWLAHVDCLEMLKKDIFGLWSILVVIVNADKRLFKTEYG